MTGTADGRRRAEEIRRREVSRALSGTDLTPEQREAVSLMSRSLVRRILEGPVAGILDRSRAAALTRACPPACLGERREA